MKHPYYVVTCVLALTVFSIFYEGQTPKIISIRNISSVDTTKDGLCVEKDSQWGKEPAPLTKEGICKCHPDQCPVSEELETTKSYPIDSHLEK